MGYNYTAEFSNMANEILGCNVVMPRHNGEREANRQMEAIRNAVMIDGSRIYIGPFTKPKVERVIFNGPATVVFWDDGSKTVVKCSECFGGCHYDRSGKAPFECKSHLYDRQKGLMAAMLKRLYKNAPDVIREHCR